MRSVALSLLLLWTLTIAGCESKTAKVKKLQDQYDAEYPAYAKECLDPETAASGKIIASADPKTSIGSRNRAIFLLLSRLGFRADDVVRLRFSDLDWKEGTIRVSGKGRRETVLPLSQEVGDALAAYAPFEISTLYHDLL